MTITDIDFTVQYNIEIGYNYKFVSEFISINPNIAFQYLRKITELFCNQILAINDFNPVKANLDTMINTINTKGFLPTDTCAELHRVRLLCNSRMHCNRNSTNVHNQDSTTPSQHKSNFENDLNDAKSARTAILNILSETFSVVHTGKQSPPFYVIEDNTQIHKNMLYDACTSFDAQKKYKAGLVVESIAKRQKRSHEYHIFTNYEAKHITSMEKIAAEFYDAACEISAVVKGEGTNTYFENNGEADIISDCDTEPLYRYGVLAAEGNLGEEAVGKGIQRLKVAADRGHKEAVSACGVVLYNSGEYELALEYLQRAGKEQDVMALRILFYYYSEGKAVPIEPDNAVKYANMAIELGCPETKALLGLAYLDGKIVEKDADKGNTILMEAKEDGSIIASKHFSEREVRRKMETHLRRELNKLCNINSIHTEANTPPARKVKIKPNELCHCGSRKKFKKCCKS